MIKILASDHKHSSLLQVLVKLEEHVEIVLRSKPFKFEILFPAEKKSDHCGKL